MSDSPSHRSESQNPAPEHSALLEGLNPAQREAVTHPGGPLLIIAGAGSGKTRVLTRRAGWLIAQGLPGAAVLAITFTNKAAQTLRERLAGLPGGHEVWAGTFHGLGAWLLRRYGERIGVPTGFTIADRDDQLRLLKAVLEERTGALARVKPAVALAEVSRRKNGAAAVRSGLGEAAAEFGAVVQAYQARLGAAALLDFDDLLLESRRLLAQVPDAAQAVRARFAHVLVDEYQDTNRVQRDLLMHLLGPERNLTVVGDPDQSIYRWRGATVTNILGFAQELSGTRTVVLDRNYRSTAHVLAAAEGVIQRIRERYEKRLVADRAPGARVRVVRCAHARDEAEVVAEALEGWARARGTLNGSAVIYRVNAQSRALELALAARGLAYRVVAGVEFFQRQEVKDVLAYARLVVNPRDEAAFARVANVPRRGVGTESLQRVRALASATGRAFHEVVRAGEPLPAGVSRRAAAGLGALAGLLDELRALPRSPVRPLLEAVVERSGYRAALEGPEGALDAVRAENVNELLGAADEYDRERPDGDVSGFLERAGLVSEQDGLPANPAPGGGAHVGEVLLLSAHSAKGLEFPCVAVVGAEQGLFPHARSVVEEGGIEEERRLFYVALTRAMDRLLVTHAAWRAGPQGVSEPRQPSPFLRDMPSGAVEGEDRARFAARLPRDDREEHVLPPSGPDEVSEGFVEAAPEPTYQRADDGFAAGDRVTHPLFGLGRVVSARGQGGESMLVVDFAARGRKTLSLRYARLERLS